MTGKTVLVTGATSGIGLETAVVLAGMGARVILVGRDAGRLEKSLGLVKSRSGADASSYRCDFASLEQVNLLADRVLAEVPRLDVLINNAGAVFAKRRLTVDGFEATFAVNHLAHFLLTERLLPRLIASAPARIITVASIGHRRGTMDFDDLGFTRGYEIMKAYGRSKLANVLFASELSRTLAGTGVTSNSVHPGGVATNIWAGAPWWAQPIIKFWLSRKFISIEEGARPLIALASKDEFAQVTGQYFNRFEAELPSAPAQDRELAARLWLESAAMIGSKVDLATDGPTS